MSERCDWCNEDIGGESYSPSECDRKYCGKVCAAYDHDDEFMTPHLKECKVRFRIEVKGRVIDYE